MSGVAKLIEFAGEEIKTSLGSAKQLAAAHKTELAATGVAYAGMKVANDVAFKNSTLNHIGSDIKDTAGSIEKLAVVVDGVPVLGEIATLVAHAGSTITYAAGGALQAGDAAFYGQLKTARNISLGTLAGVGVHAVPFTEVADLGIAGKAAVFGGDARSLAKRADDTVMGLLEDKAPQPVVSGGQTVARNSGVAPSATPGEVARRSKGTAPNPAGA